MALTIANPSKEGNENKSDMANDGSLICRLFSQDESVQIHPFLLYSGHDSTRGAYSFCLITRQRLRFLHFAQR